MVQVERNPQTEAVFVGGQVWPKDADCREYLECMSNLPTSVSLVTTGQGDQRMGLTVSAFCSLSTEPPSLVVCVNKNAGAHQALLDNGVFAVNVLSNTQKDYARLFSTKSGDRFASEEWLQSEAGVPLLGSALMAFDCRVEKVVDGFSHSILIGVVQRILAPRNGHEQALVWQNRRFGQITALEQG